MEILKSVALAILLSVSVANAKKSPERELWDDLKAMEKRRVENHQWLLANIGTLNSIRATSLENIKTLTFVSEEAERFRRQCHQVSSLERTKDCLVKAKALLSGLSMLSINLQFDLYPIEDLRKSAHYSILWNFEEPYRNSKLDLHRKVLLAETDLHNLVDSLLETQAHFQLKAAMEDLSYNKKRGVLIGQCAAANIEWVTPDGRKLAHQARKATKERDLAQIYTLSNQLKKHFLKIQIFEKECPAHPKLWGPMQTQLEKISNLWETAKFKAEVITHYCPKVADESLKRVCLKGDFNEIFLSSLSSQKKGANR